jgi:cytosine/adenosine deaminase-related metal-dependent hydrolase
MAWLADRVDCAGGEMMLSKRGVTFINACPQGGVQSLRVVGARITAINVPAVAGDTVVDLRGARLLPGLINAHDHLQLNTLPAIDPSRRYVRAHEWILDVDRRRRTEPDFAALVAVPRNDRLLVGGIKNLLSGVTTVAHHDPLYPFLLDGCFPTRVVTNCGWSHSLYIDGEDAVRESCRATPPDHPWIIHAGEGMDAESAGEFDRLEALGCIRDNTLIVHGLALDSRQRSRLDCANSGLVWCPSSNLRLFGRTADVEWLIQRGRVTLGTDSRLSGAGDLLDELRIARECSQLSESLLESLVTRRAAALLRLTDRGALGPGSLADLVVVPAQKPLSGCRRTDIELVMLGGAPRYAHSAHAEVLAPQAFWTQIRVDGHPRMLASQLAQALSAARCGEPGVEIADLKWRAA